MLRKYNQAFNSLMAQISILYHYGDSRPLLHVKTICGVLKNAPDCLLPQISKGEARVAPPQMSSCTLEVESHNPES